MRINDIIPRGLSFVKIKKLTAMLIFLHRTYRGRTYKWWLQSMMILILVVVLSLFTYYFLDLHRDYQQLRAENKRLEPYIATTHETGLNGKQVTILARLDFTHDYLQYLNHFEHFEKKARLAKLMRVYQSKQVLYRQKNELELVLNSELAAPVLLALGKDLSMYSQQWENATVSEKNQLQGNFKQTIQLYENVFNRHGYKILSSDWMRNKVIQYWYDFILNQTDEWIEKNEAVVPSYQELYPKLDNLVEFYFQRPTVDNNWIKPDRALLEKTKNQLKIV